MTKEEKSAYMRQYRAAHPSYRKSDSKRATASKRLSRSVSAGKLTSIQVTDKLEFVEQERDSRRLGFGRKLPTPKAYAYNDPLSRHPDIDQMYLDWETEVASGKPRTKPTSNFGPPQSTMGTIAHQKYAPKSPRNIS